LNSGAVGGPAAGDPVVAFGVLAVIGFPALMGFLVVFDFLAAEETYLVNSVSEVLDFLAVLG